MNLIVIDETNNYYKNSIRRQKNRIERDKPLCVKDLSACFRKWSYFTKRLSWI